MTVVFGVDFDSLQPDLAAALRAADSPTFRVSCLKSTASPDARLIAIAGAPEAEVGAALAQVSDSGAEVVAIGGYAHEVAALDAGAVDFVAWPSLSQSLGGQLTATARRLTRLGQQRGDYQRKERLDALKLRIANANLDVDSLAQLVCDELVASEDLRAMTRADGAVVELIEGSDLVYRAAAGAIGGYRGFRLPLAGTLSQQVIERREILCTGDVDSDPRVNLNACRVVGIRSMAATPLICDDRAVGTLKMVSTSTEGFGALDQRILGTMGELLSAAMQREMERQRLRVDLAERGEALQALERESHNLRTLATTDPLTGLLNRRQFVAAAEEALRRGAGRRPGLAVLMLDLDQFKSINDTHGHAGGDAVLVAVAGWLNATLREGDIVGRIGGEEFAVVLPRVDQPAALAAAERIRVAIEAGVVPFEGEWLRTTVSIGVAIVAALTGQEEAFRRADSALYRAKAGGRNRVALHEIGNVVSIAGSATGN